MGYDEVRLGGGELKDRHEYFEECYKLIRKLRGLYIGSGMGWNAREKKEEMAQTGMKYILLVEAGKVIAFCSYLNDYEDELNVVYLYELHVSKTHQRGGLGKLLLDKTVSAARESNVPYVMLTAFRHNKNAVSFYQKNGFSFHDDNSENWFRMILHV